MAQSPISLNLEPLEQKEKKYFVKVVFID